MGMTQADDFRRQTEEARQMDIRSLKQEGKAFRLRLAEDWIKLAQEADAVGKRL
jgi:anaerobic glycerol-3-phosphate dehydrogenase